MKALVHEFAADVVEDGCCIFANLRHAVAKGAKGALFERKLDGALRKGLEVRVDVIDEFVAELAARLGIEGERHIQWLVVSG